MGPDISKGLNTQVTAQDCHKDGGNQVGKIKGYCLIILLIK
jgi:hypothetical protein